MLHYIKGDGFMNSVISLKKLKENARLEKLIMKNADYEEIINESKILDKYVQLKLKQMYKK